MTIKNSYLRSKVEERSAKSAMLQTLQDVAAKESRDLTVDERKTFDEIVSRLGALDADIERIKAFDEGAAKFVSLVGAHAESVELAERAAEHDHDRGHVEQRSASFGKMFVESTAFTAYKGSGTSGRVTLPGPASPEFRAAISLGEFGENYPPERWAGPAGPAERTPFLDALGRVATNQGSVVFLKWSKPSEAQVVAEGALKPEATLTLTPHPLMLETVAHYKAITRQALEDIPQVQSIVQNKLLRGVRNKLESLAAAALVAATDIPEAAGATLLEGIRVAIATAEAKGYTCNAIVLNPADAAALDLAAMGASFSGPVRSGSAWGVPVVAAPILPAGTAYVGDLSQGVTWFDRGVTDVYLSDSHADFFLRNQLVILAEARSAFAVPEPESLVKVTVEGDSSGGE